MSDSACEAVHGGMLCAPTRLAPYLTLHRGQAQEWRQHGERGLTIACAICLGNPTIFVEERCFHQTVVLVQLSPVMEEQGL